MKVLSRLVSIGFVLAGTLGGEAARADADRLAAEAARRHDALVKEGFNLTHEWSFAADDPLPAIRLELLVPPHDDEEHTISFWGESTLGALGFRLTGPDGKALACWAGRRGESAVSALLPSGKMVVEIERPAGAAARGVLGIRGPALQRCEPRSGSVDLHPPDASRGFHWPYLLFVPAEVRSGRLLVVPNNTGFSTDDPELLRASGSCEVVRQAKLAERLGAPLLVPLFPRPVSDDGESNLYLHALTRASLETGLPSFRRVDLQLVAMVDDARSVLRGRKVEVDSRVLLRGFSASGSFVSRFAMLHPDRVAAVACGSPGGWPIAPVAKLEGEPLPYPVGVADVEELVGRPLDLRRLRKVAWYVFLGDRDENDAVPFRDSFSKEDEDLIFRRFGKTPVERWGAAERLYAERGLDARFRLFPGVAHATTAEIEEEVARFFEGVAERERKP